jgi:hypothetical protein
MTRHAFRLLWRWKSRPRATPVDSASSPAVDHPDGEGANRTWGEERITAELLLNFGISVSLLGPWSAPFPLRQSAGRSNASDINTDLFPCDEFDIPPLVALPGFSRQRQMPAYQA